MPNYLDRKYDGGYADRRPSASDLSSAAGSDRLAERIIGGIECEFRDWLSPDEYAQAKRIIKQIIESEYQSQNSRRQA